MEESRLQHADFSCGAQGISDSYYEAAELDGARWHQKFMYVTVPLLSPTTFFVTVMSFIGSFQVFDTVFLMTQGDRRVPPP
ncbi:sugar ABC transporter permease [Paenibacillus sp. P26]|nr:sugar ABC transporter permease [Paenibacillus sp. P26]